MPFNLEPVTFGAPSGRQFGRHLSDFALKPSIPVCRRVPIFAIVVTQLVSQHAGSTGTYVVRSRLESMSVDRRELHELIDSLPDDQVPSAVEDLRRRAHPRPEPHQRAFAWIGKGVAKDGVTDLSTNPEHLNGFGRSSQ